MAAPLLQSIFKPTNFDLFLDEIGLDEVTGEVRIALIDKIREAVEFALVTKIFSLLTPPDKIKLVNLLQEGREKNDDSAVNDFMLEKLPNIEYLVDEAIESVKDEFRFSTANIEADIQKQLAMLDHMKQAGQAKEVDEEYLPPRPIDEYSPDEQPVQVMPDPIDPGQERPRSPLSDLRRDLQQSAPAPLPPETLDADSDTDAPEASDTAEPSIEEITIPPAPTPSPAAAASESEAAINDELAAITGVPAPTPPTPPAPPMPPAAA